MSDPELPTGVVTFLLTDIVGSTRLWEADATLMAAALVRHDEILFDAVTSCGGTVVKAQGEGDSSFSVFRRASDAARASLVAQTRLRDATWPTARPIRVRMALHAGEAEERAGDYYGRTVNRAARLRAIAEGEQILVSQATAELIRDHLPGRSELAVLGAYELKDLERPETVYVLSSVDAPHAAPPPKQHRILMPALLATAKDGTFIGRSHERDVIATSVSAAAAGERRVVLVAGEPGLGKTALCAQSAVDAYERGVTVLYGRCDPDLVAPYRPFVEALSDYLAQLDDGTLRTMEARHLAELTRLVPNLRARRPGLPQPQPSDPESERYLLLGAIVGVIAEISVDNPMLIVIDDLHWADRSTLLALRHLVSAPTTMRLLVVATYRDNEVVDGHPLADALTGLHRSLGVEDLPLRGLVDTEMVQLVTTSQGDSDDAASLARDLQRETDGNPLFAGEILRHLVELGALAHGATQWRLTRKLSELELPEGVRAVVRSRVECLGERAQRVLATAAILGNTFALPLLATVAQVDDGDVLDDLERAERAQLVTETGKPEQFRFAHALIQHTLYESTGTTRRVRLHRRAAEELETNAREGGDVAIAELAYHWDRGTAGSDRSKALVYIERAGDAALSQLAPDEALVWYARALELHESVAPDNAALRCDLVIGLGEAQRQTGVPAYRETLLEASGLAEQLGDASRMVTAALANNRGFVSAAGTIDIERVAALDAALSSIPGDDYADRARLVSAKARELLFNDDFAARRTLSDQAVDLARLAADDVTLLSVFNDRCLTMMVPWTLADRDAETAEALRLAHDVGDPVARFYAAYNRACVALEAADLDDFEANIVGPMTSVSTELQQPTLLWVRSWAEAYRLLLRGDLQDAENMALESLRIGTESGQPDALTNFGGLLLGLRWHQGRLRELVSVVAETAESLSAIPAYRAVLALAHIESDDLDAAAALLRTQIDERFERIPEDLFWSVAVTAYSDAAVATGSVAAAELLCEKVDPFHGQIASSTASINGAYAHCSAGLHELLGHHDIADERYGEAIALHTKVRAPFFIARTKLAWGRALIRRNPPGGDDRARALLADAASLAARYGYENIERWSQSADR